MRYIKKLATVLKFLGIAVLCLAVAFSLYSLINSGGHWNNLKNALNGAGAKTSLLDRIAADKIYFTALSDAAATCPKDPDAQKSQTDADIAKRAALLISQYDGYQARASKAEEVKTSERWNGVADYLNKEFDYASFVENYNVDDTEAARVISEACAYLDKVCVKMIKGKPLPKQAGEEASVVLPNAYEALCADHGEAAGDYWEYAQIVMDMVKATVDGGAAVPDLNAFAKGIEWEAYESALETLKNAESVENNNLLAAFHAFAEKKLAGEAVDAQMFLKETCGKLAELYPDEQLSDDAVAVAVKNLLPSGKFDGAYASVLKEAKAIASAQSAASFSAWVAGTQTIELVKRADQSASIVGITVFWKIIALTAYWWLAGIALLILSKVIVKLMNFVMLRSLKDAGIQEESDVLLRVDHLKQYFRSGNYVNKAVDDVSFYIKKGEVFGLVGESGCGKTTTGRTIINLYDPTGGDVYFQGLGISSTQNGLSAYKRQKRNEVEQIINGKKAKLESDIALAQKDSATAPAKKKELTAQYNQEVRALKREMRADFVAAEKHALRSSVEKDKCVEMYRARRKAELTAEYEKDIKSLSGEALAEREQRYKTEMKVAAKDNIMARMQMIFQDPIASINPRMTVREIIAEGLIIRGVKDKKYINDKVNEVLELVGLVREHADRYPHEFSGGQRQRIGIARAIVMQPDLIIADEPISALDVSIQAQVINLMNDLRNRMGLTIMFIAHNLSVVKYFSDRIGVMYFGHLVELASSDELFAHPLHPYTKSLLSAIPLPDPHLEKTRKRIEYNPAKTHDYSVDQPTMREVAPGHFVRCNQAEFEKYKKELGN